MLGIPREDPIPPTLLTRWLAAEELLYERAQEVCHRDFHHSATSPLVYDCPPRADALLFQQHRKTINIELSTDMHVSCFFCRVLYGPHVQTGGSNEACESQCSESEKLVEMAFLLVVPVFVVHPIRDFSGAHWGSKRVLSDIR